MLKASLRRRSSCFRWHFEETPSRPILFDIFRCAAGSLFCVSPFLCSKLSEALDLFCRGFAHERLFCSPHKTHLHFPCSSLDAGSPKLFPYKYILFSFCHLRFLSMTDKVERISTGFAKHTNMREQGEVTGSSSSTEIAVYFKAV